MLLVLQMIYKNLNLKLLLLILYLMGNNEIHLFYLLSAIQFLVIHERCQTTYDAFEPDGHPVHHLMVKIFDIKDVYKAEEVYMRILKHKPYSNALRSNISTNAYLLQHLRY